MHRSSSCHSRLVRPGSTPRAMLQNRHQRTEPSGAYSTPFFRDCTTRHQKYRTQRHGRGALRRSRVEYRPLGIATLQTSQAAGLAPHGMAWSGTSASASSSDSFPVVASLASAGDNGVSSGGQVLSEGQRSEHGRFDRVGRRLEPCRRSCRCASWGCCHSYFQMPFRKRLCALPDCG